MIFINNLTKITDTKYSIGYTHFNPFDTKNGIKDKDGNLYTMEQLKQIGKLVDLPDPLPVKNNNPQVLYYNPVADLCFYEYQNTETLDQAKQAKVQELEDDCTKVKDGGFKSSCLGAEKTFDSSPENRNLIVGLAMKAGLIASGTTLSDSTLDWKAKDEPVCYPWQPQQMIMLGVDLSTFMTNTIKHKEQLQAYANTLTTVEEVQKVTWDTQIPTT